MKKQWIYGTIVFLSVLLFGCSTVDNTKTNGGAEEQSLRARQTRINMLRRQLDQVHSNINDGNIDEAELCLRPLLEYDFLKNDVDFLESEVDMLEATIADARKILNYKGRNKVDTRRMMGETEEKVALPKTYGKTVVIDAKLPPVRVPAGFMEEILNKRVSISLDNAGIAELVAALKETCKINTIADEALSSNKTLSISVTSVPLKEILSYISRNMNVAFHLGENLLWVTGSEEVNSGPILETRIIRLRQGTLPQVPSGGGVPGASSGGAGTTEDKEDNELTEVLETLMEGSPEGATFKIFKDRNILVVRDTRENLRLVEDLVEEFDKAPYQVVIEARFITVSQDDLHDLGTELTLQNKQSHHTPQESAALKAIDMLTSLGALKTGAEQGVGLLNFSGVMANRTFDVIISALDKKASTVTLSVPKVTVMNNRQARIRKGDTIYYFEEYDTVDMDRGDYGTETALVPSGSPTKLPVGLTFDVKVNVGNDGRTVLLGLKPEIVEFKGWESYLTSGSSGDGDDDSSSSSSSSGLTQIKLPRTYEQSVVTTVGVTSGQTVVLGGMLENKRSKTVKKVPFLGDIPLLGYLFRHEEITHTPINLLIFVTATVINHKGEFVEVLPEGVPER